MSVYIDRKYLGQLSFRLEQFKQKKPDLYNFRCPLCGDSQKNKTKTRGYIYRKENNYFYSCKNCGVGTTFSNLLKSLDAQAHRQYVLECYAQGENKHAPVEKPKFTELKGNAFARLHDLAKRTVDLPSIAELPSDHPARSYIEARKIPEKAFGLIFYAENFKQFMDSEFPDHGKENIPDDPRIVLLYKNVKGDITNVAGRALENTKIRYITVKVSDETKVFGLDRVDFSKRVYITEGQFDSLFLDNAIAAGDSNLIGLALDLSNTHGLMNPILCFDNEPRNKDIVKQIGRAIELNNAVVIYPESVEGKDINDMVLSGYDVAQLVESNICAGATAKLKYVHWKKC